MADWQQFQDRVIAFRDSRDWKQFHNPKDLALSLVLEAAEVMEHFQWKSVEEMKEYIKTNKTEIADELCDVIYWVATMSRDLGIDIPEAFEKRCRKTNKSIPSKNSKAFTPSTISFNAVGN